MNKPLLIALASVVFASCAVGPDYKRPHISVPAEWRTQASTDSNIANMEYWDVYQDPVLRGYIAAALDTNLDLMAAVGRINEAGSQVTMTKADLYPQVDLQAQGGAMQMSKNRYPGFSEELVGGIRGDLGLTALLSWELDIFGRIRRSTERQNALLAATEAGQRAAVIAVVASVAESYVLLRQADRLKEILDSNVASRREYVRLARTLFQGGKSSELDYQQAESELRRVEAKAPIATRDIQQQENALNVLLNRVPGNDLPRGNTLSEQYILPETPSGQPASILERRPDIIIAEQQLVAANADVGVATAQLFPRIGIGTQGGFGSLNASNFFDPNSLTWAAGANLAQPLFNAGKNLARVDAAEGVTTQQEAAYRLTVLNAFREVNNQLIAIETSRQSVESYSLNVGATREVLRLSELRYRYGAAPYLQVLDAQRSLLTAQERELKAQTDLMLALIRLYKALGGGWTVAG